MSNLIRLIFIGLLFISQLNCSKKKEIITPIDLIDFEYKTDKNGLVQFTNLSSVSGDFSWNFGDSTYSKEFAPNHQYFINANYPVNLKLGKKDTTKQIQISTSNTIFNKQQIDDYYSATIGGGTSPTKRGVIYSELNGVKGTTQPEQLPTFYNINSKYLFLSYWMTNNDNKLFIFVPEAKIEKNDYNSFLNARLSFEQSRFLNGSGTGSLNETEGKWQLTKFEQNKLSGTYEGKFFSASENKIYDIKFTFVDIFIPFVLTDFGR